MNTSEKFSDLLFLSKNEDVQLNRDKEMPTDNQAQLRMVGSSVHSVFKSGLHQKYEVFSSRISNDILNFSSNENWRVWCNLLATNLRNLDFKEKCKEIIIKEEIRRNLCDFDTKLYENLFEAIKDYESSKIKNTFFSDISKESQECVLLILPILACRKNIDIHIDSSNGNVNIDISHNSNGILNLQVASGKLIYFSYVGENDNIFKITGKIKLKSDYDLIELNRICNLL